MSFPRYPKYKDSGVEWLGDVPSHWAITRLKWLCDIQTGGRDTEHAVEDGPYPFFVRSQTVERIDSFTFNCEAILTAGDGAGVGKVFHHFTGAFDFHQRVYMLNRFRGVQGSFLFHYLRENFYKVALEGGAKSTVDSLRRPMFTNFAVALPPTDEQELIAEFCARETAKIDALVAEQERLIELLKEKRQAVISNAVTKGLDPRTPMKDSGIKWIGDVPAHWTAGPMRRLPCFVQTGPFGSQLHAEEYVRGGTPVVNPMNLVEGRIVPDEDISVGPQVVERLAHQVLRQGDIVFARRGELGRCALVTPTESGWLCGTGSMIVRLEGVDFDSAYLTLYLSLPIVRQYFESFSVGAIMDSLSTPTLLGLPVLLPPRAEQAAIAEFVKVARGELDALTAEAERAVALLQERRSALITAAVTGQIDVREAAARSAA